MKIMNVVKKFVVPAVGIIGGLLLTGKCQEEFVNNTVEYREAKRLASGNDSTDEIEEPDTEEEDEASE